MKSPALVFLSAAAATACLAADPISEPKSSPGTEAETKAAAWLAGLGEKGLVIVERREHPEKSGFVGQPIAGSKNTMFVLTDQHWYITLGFEGAVDESTPLETLREKFSYIALDKLPTPGLEIPGWEISPRTPVSSLSKPEGAVEFLAAGDGKISLRVKTHFFALYGRDPSVLVPADAPSPPGSYFQIRQRFELDLTLEAPFKMGK